MKKINKLILAASLFCATSMAFADDPSSPFTCQKQAQSRTGFYITQPYECPAGTLPWVQLGNGQNAAFCMSNSGAGPKNAPNSVCEVNPQYWAEYAPARHVCQGTPEQCAMQIS